MTQQPPRIMIAKPGLDGHDRGAVVLVQSLRDSGYDVLYSGIRRTPKQIAIAAAQEDVDILGLSTLSGAHNTLLKLIKEELDQLSWNPDLLIAGGIIPEGDVDHLKSIGYHQIFGPGSSVADIDSFIKQSIKHRQERKQTSSHSWVQCSQILTQIENNSSKSLSSSNGLGKVILIAGQGGVGKSSLLGGLLQVATEQNKKIAILANDPAHAISGGSILGDRLRMPMNFPPEQHLIRSIPVRNDEGMGMASYCGSMSQYLKSSYDLILIETYGLGQNQIPSMNSIDQLVTVISPGLGDHWQLRKLSILNQSDLIVLNKSDLPESTSLHEDLLSVLEHQDHKADILETSSQSHDSLKPLFKKLLTS